MIPEGFIPWLEKFCANQVFIRIVLNPYPRETDAVIAVKAIEIVTGEANGPWVYFTLREHLNGRDRKNTSFGHCYWPMRQAEDLIKLTDQWKGYGWGRDFCVQHQIAAFSWRGGRLVRISPSHPRVIAAMGELGGYLWGLTEDPRVPGSVVRVLRDRLQGMLADTFRQIETVFPLTWEDA